MKNTPSIILALLMGGAWLAPAATHFQVLKSFGSSTEDGLVPQASLIQASDGALYGTTTRGGSSNVGTVFRTLPDGSGYSIVYSFINDGLDGKTPSATLMEGSDGLLYGTTSAGGTNGMGTLFRLNKSGSGYVVLHHFGSLADGSIPLAGLVEGSDGALYGTTSSGGTNALGTVFKLSKDGGGYAVLHHFGGSGDGWDPVAALLQASDGALYGTTKFGGITNFNSNGSGTVFKLNKDGSTYSVLHGFTGFWEGANPTAALVEGIDGFLYGTTAGTLGGDYGTNGIVFKLEKDGSGYASLAIFLRANQGVGGLVEGRDGQLYGTMARGYDYYYTYPGIAFAVPRNASDPIFLYSFDSFLHSFDSPQHGSAVSLLRAGDGLFYGTTTDGGDFGSGAVFRLWPPETPDLLDVSLAGNTAQLRLAGADGQRYQVLRSTDLTNWLVIATITMPIGGIYTNLDSSSPGTAAYYRAAWIP